VDIGAPSVAPSAHANRAGASGEVDVVDDGTHTASGVTALEWLAATLGGGDVAAGGTGARNSANNDAQSDDDDKEPATVLEAIHGQGVNLGVSLGVGLGVSPPPRIFLDY